MKVKHLIFLCLLALTSACLQDLARRANPILVAEMSSMDALEVMDAFEAWNDEHGTGRDDRDYALQLVREMKDDGSAGYALSHGSLAARAAESRGMLGLSHITEAERWARRSVDRDSEFRDGAARRMLGTIYIFAGKYLPQGDSEEGLELLEKQVEMYPEQAANQLRLGEGYLALGDDDEAIAPLCLSQQSKGDLRREEQKLLKKLLKDLPEGPASCSVEN